MSDTSSQDNPQADEKVNVIPAEGKPSQAEGDEGDDSETAAE